MRWLQGLNVCVGKPPSGQFAAGAESTAELALSFAQAGAPSAVMAPRPERLKVSARAVSIQCSRITEYDVKPYLRTPLEA